jgi:hypothetical protein
MFSYVLTEAVLSFKVQFQLSPTEDFYPKNPGDYFAASCSFITCCKSFNMEAAWCLFSKSKALHPFPIRCIR